MRTLDGGVSVYDVNRDFAELHDMPEVTGPVAIDAARDLLITISPIDSVLQLIELKEGDLVAESAVDLSTIGTAAALALGDRPDKLVVLGTAGIAEIALNKAAANRVEIQQGQNVDSVLFGLVLSDTNTAPQYESLPDLSTREDTSLVLPAPAALEGRDEANGAVDAQGDQFVIVQVGPAANGTATIGIHGTVQYTPNRDFFGTDHVPVVLHDGRDVTGTIQLPITVTPQSDPPTDIIVEGDPISENLEPVAPVAQIDVIDVDLNDNHIITLEDGRFMEQNGQIIFINGQLDFETEPLISISVTVTDSEDGESIERVITLRVADENDPDHSHFTHRRLGRRECTGRHGDRRTDR